MSAPTGVSVDLPANAVVTNPQNRSKETSEKCILSKDDHFHVTRTLKPHSHRKQLLKGSGTRRSGTLQARDL